MVAGDGQSVITWLLMICTCARFLFGAFKISRDMTHTVCTLKLPRWMMNHKYEYFLDRKESSKGTFRYLTELISNQTIYHPVIIYHYHVTIVIIPSSCDLIIMWLSLGQSRDLSKMMTFAFPIWQDNPQILDVLEYF